MDWIEHLKSGKKAKLWAGFLPATEQEIEALESAISRSLPDDLVIPESGEPELVCVSLNEGIL